MHKSRVQAEIEKSNEVGDKMGDQVVARGSFPCGDRNNLLAAYWSVVCECHRGVICLLSHNFPGPAFALLRTIVEATIRAHVVLIGTDAEIEALKNDTYRTSFTRIGAEIDAKFRTGTMFNDWLTRGRDVLHSFTHAGMAQVGRRFAGNDLRPNYTDEAVIELVQNSTSAVFLVTNLVTKHFAFEDEWNEVNRLYAEWGGQ